MIYHPLSPFKGQHYTKPVELLDVFPTLVDLTRAPFNTKKACNKDTVCKPLEGKSLAPVVLGQIWTSQKKGKTIRRAASDDKNTSIGSISLARDFSLTQVWRCVNEEAYNAAKKLMITGTKSRPKIWGECEKDKKPPNEISVMGYSMRTNDYRYTAWMRMDRSTEKPFFDEFPLEEDLFDHRNETLKDFTHQETSNIARRVENQVVLLQLRDKLLKFLKSEVNYRGPFEDR